MKRIILAISMLTLSVHAGPDESSDVVVYGGSPSGLSAAVQAARLGSRVVVVEPYLKIGGMMAAGLTRTDLGDAATTGGLCREFFERLAEHYDLLGIKRERYYDFEPHVAGIIWSKMLEETGRIEVLEHTRLTAVDKDGSALRAIQVRTQDSRTLRIAGKVFIDATYEGDLAADGRGALSGGARSQGRVRRAARPGGGRQAAAGLLFPPHGDGRPGEPRGNQKPEGYDPKEFGLLAEICQREEHRAVRARLPLCPGEDPGKGGRQRPVALLGVDRLGRVSTTTTRRASGSVGRRSTTSTSGAP